MAAVNPADTLCTGRRPVSYQKNRFNNLVQSCQCHYCEEYMIYLEDYILGLPLSVSLVIHCVVKEWIWDNYLEEDFPDDDLPVACSPEVIIFGDELLDIKPLKIDHMAEDKREYMN